MKKLFILFGVIAFIAISGCKKDIKPGSLSNQDIVNQIFTAGMTSYNSSQTTKSAEMIEQSLKSTIQLNYPVDYTVTGPEGGNIHVIGSISGSMSFNDQTAAILGGTMLFNMTETINDYKFISNGQTYTMNGAPDISLAGTFTFQPGGTFGTASSIEIGGGVKVTGPGVSETVNIDLTININSSGTGGDVSGTIGGVSVNYSF